MLAEWCVRWRDGLTICGKPTHCPTGFYYLAADRQWKSHQIWFDAVGFPDIPHYSLADDHRFELARLAKGEDAHACFLDCLNQLAPIPGSHVFVDPVSPLFICGDSNRARDVARTMLWLSRLCRERSINITCAAHFAKQRTDPKEQYTRPQDRISGSGAFAGFSDTQMYLIDPCPPEQPSHVLGWVPRHAPLEEFKFTRNTEGLFVPFELYQEMDRVEAVLACFPDTAIAMAAVLLRITERVGLSAKSGERYVALLLKDGRIAKVSRGIYQKSVPS